MKKTRKWQLPPTWSMIPPREKLFNTLLYLNGVHPLCVAEHAEETRSKRGTNGLLQFKVGYDRAVGLSNISNTQNAHLNVVPRWHNFPEDEI